MKCILFLHSRPKSKPEFNSCCMDAVLVPGTLISQRRAIPERGAREGGTPVDIFGPTYVTCHFSPIISSPMKCYSPRPYFPPNQLLNPLLASEAFFSTVRSKASTSFMVAFLASLLYCSSFPSALAASARALSTYGGC
jgi:hypothetical protein